MREATLEEEIKKTQDATANCLRLIVSGSLTSFQREQIRQLARLSYYMGVLDTYKEQTAVKRLLEGYDDDELCT